MRKRNWSLLAFFAAFLLNAAAWGADVTGTWKGDLAIGGNQLTVTYEFKQDGEKLTGTAAAGEVGTTEIKEGKVQGEKISFYVETNDGKFAHEGELKGEEITLTLKGDNGMEGSITLKKEK